jgi:hypothetical protein
MTVAVILIHLAASATIAKQMAACVGYVDRRHYQLAGYIERGTPADAVRMVKNGEAEVVVVAFGGRDIAAEVIDAGGRVEAVHPIPHIVEPPVPPPVKVFPRSVVALLRKMQRRGHSASEIAHLIGEDTGEVMRLLQSPEIE